MRPGRDERGVVAVLTAICLLVVMAGVALTVDIGGLLLRRRAMVNGADAAALAAAQACATPTGDAQAIAFDYAAKNVPGASLTQTTFSDHRCHVSATGYVTVGYTGEQSLFFAPALGFDHTSPVSGEATASWGAAGADSIIPLVVFSGTLQSACNIPNVTPGTTCYIWEDNFDGGNFGFIDVGNWGVNKDAQCDNSNGQLLDDWIAGRVTVGTLELNYPRATWACTLGGERGNAQAWREMEKLAEQDAVRTFPVLGTSPEDHEPPYVGPPMPKYNVIGFAEFQIMDVFQASKVPEPGIVVERKSFAGDAWPVPYDLKQHIPTGGTYEGAVMQPSNVNGWSISADGILGREAGAHPNGPNSVTIQWSTELDAGSCGPPPVSGQSSHCIVLKWNGATIGEGRPGGGADFGVRAVQLCDRAYRTCLDQP